MTQTRTTAQGLDEGFILSRHWQDTEHGIELRFWLVNEQQAECWRVAQQESVCFVAVSQLARWQSVWARHSVHVRVGDTRFATFAGQQAVPIYTPSFKQQRQWVRRGRDIHLQVWEDDILPSDRYLMERFLFGGVNLTGPKPSPANVRVHLNVLSIDIETAWYTPGETPQLYSVALATEHYRQVFCVLPPTPQQAPENTLLFPDIAGCLRAVVDAIQQCDPDCIIGWNVIDFDLQILQQHCDAQQVPFTIGRDGSVPQWRQRGDNSQRFYIDVEGRQVVDGPGAFRSAAWSFEDYTLETVAQSVLQRGKRISESDDRVDEIDRMYHHDLTALAAYNLEDAVLVLDLFEQAGLWHFLQERAHLTGLSMDRVGGSSAAFNTVYLPRLHRRGYIAPNVGEQTLAMESPGGFVMDSVPGFYDDVLVLDFKSLYPSIIQTFMVDPWGLQEGLKLPDSETVPGFLDARFSRNDPILPTLIQQLWQARDRAKQERNAPLSQAIKIIMNSFYGVLGSHLCRFFDPRLASSITRRGHDILQLSREFIEQQGYRVIYGDTDSVFVHVPNHARPSEVGQQLAQALNTYWQDRLQQEFAINSALEMEFETHYKKFFMPTIRGTDTGSKKRYAGLLVTDQGDQLVFKGLEAVRSDWTELAKRFQRELYRRVFAQEDYAELIQTTVQRLKAGELDDQLVYKRRLRQRVEDYDKQKPPHVQAAALKQQLNPRWQGRRIEYVKTVNGWQPLGHVTAALDYEHYLEKQMAPIADAILHFFDQRFDELTNQQMGLF